MEDAPLTSEALERALRDDPNSFEFFQAVHHLERLHPARAPVGGFGPPNGEVVRFGAHTAVAFPASQIQTLDLDAEGPARMRVNFMGLTGPQGVLPLHYTSLIAERERARDTAGRDFIDIFNHRIISLFYRAWEKNRFIVPHERGQTDPLMRHLMDLVGVGTPGLAHRLPVRDESLVFYSGLFAMPTRPAIALEHLVEDYFGVPAEIEQFVGGWYPLDATTQCALGDDDTESSALGLGAVAGDETWDQQARIRIRLGPMPRTKYDMFLPDGGAHGELRALAAFFTGGRIDVDVQLILDRGDVPPCVLGADDDGAAPLGWCTWLRTAPLDHDPDETVLTL